MPAAIYLDLLTRPRTKQKSNHVERQQKMLMTGLLWDRFGKVPSCCCYNCGGGRRRRSKGKNSCVISERSACRFVSRHADWQGAETATGGDGNAGARLVSWFAFLDAEAWKTNCPALRSSVIEMMGNSNQIRHARAITAMIRRRLSGKDRTRAPQRSSKSAATTSHARLSASSTLVATLGRADYRADSIPERRGKIQTFSATSRSADSSSPPAQLLCYMLLCT